jgi:hypothetical protein
MLSTTRILCAALTLSCAAPAFAEDLQFELINNSGYTIVQFFTSPSNMDEWREDVLGTQVVAPGESGTVSVTDGSDQCAYDIRVVLDDGSEISDAVDMCAMGAYTIN